MSSTASVVIGYLNTRASLVSAGHEEELSSGE